jgi:hypothetical protein
MRPTFDLRLGASFLTAILAFACFLTLESAGMQEDSGAAYSEAEVEAAKERKQKEIADIREFIRGLEKKRKLAGKDPEAAGLPYNADVLGLFGDGTNILARQEDTTDWRRYREERLPSDSRGVDRAGDGPNIGGLFGSQPGAPNGQRGGRTRNAGKGKFPAANDIQPANKKKLNYAESYFDLRIREAKEDLAEVTKLKPAVFAAILRSEQEQAADRRQRLDAEQQKIEEWKEQQAKEQSKEEEAVVQSGNCPIRPLSATFAHLEAAQTRVAFTDAFGPSTAIYFEVLNRSKSRVIAWEIEYELLDGFDEVIASGTHKMTAINSQTKDEAFFAVRQVPEAVQMKVYTRRAKLEDGTLWERLPEHKMVGFIVKKLDGADLVKQRSR